MKKTELLDLLKQRHKTQKQHPEEDLYETLEELKAENVACDLDVDKHRWYETSITVYKVPTDEGDMFFGVRACTGIFSEDTGFEDICWEYSFFEMEEINKPIYVIKGA